METGSKGKRPVRVSIAGQSFTLVTAGEDREVLDLAHSVDELIATIASRSSHSDPTRLAILACLHLADKHQASERELQSIRAAVLARAKRIEGLLDQLMDAPEPHSDEPSAANSGSDSVRHDQSRARGAGDGPASG